MRSLPGLARAFQFLAAQSELRHQKYMYYFTFRESVSGFINQFSAAFHVLYLENGNSAKDLCRVELSFDWT